MARSEDICHYWPSICAKSMIWASPPNCVSTPSCCSQMFQAQCLRVNLTEAVKTTTQHGKTLPSNQFDQTCVCCIQLENNSVQRNIKRKQTPSYQQNPFSVNAQLNVSIFISLSHCILAKSCRCPLCCASNSWSRQSLDPTYAGGRVDLPW